MREDAGVENRSPRKKLQFGMGPTFGHFSPQRVSDADLERIMDAARPASTEWNLHAWRWIVVRGEAARSHLEAASYIKVPLSSAPVVLVCIADTLAWKSAPQLVQEMISNRKITDEEGREALRRLREYYSSSPDVAERTALANAFVAVHHSILSATECGLSAYWVTEFDEAKIRTYFHIPDHFLVAALIPIGYHEPTPPPPASKHAAPTYVYREKFGETPTR